MDGVSGAASVIALIQILGQVFDLCRTYYLEVKEARKDIQRLRDEVTSLEDVLTSVADLQEETSASNLSILSLVNKPDGLVQRCLRDLADLVTRLDPGQGKNKMRQFGSRALKWPFSREDVDKLLATIGRHKLTFNLALTADHVALAHAIQSDVEHVADGVAELQIGQRTLIAEGRRQEIQRLLSSPDPSPNHNSACKNRQATTGVWLVDGDEFEKWKSTPKSFLWLHGIPGCGKTILCSTIIEDIKSHYESMSQVAIAYFYFDFNDAEKQRYENLLRSLIGQLSLQSETCMKALNDLVAPGKSGQERLKEDGLISTIKLMLGEFEQTFIILDALDECHDRTELLALLEDIIDWEIESLHLLVASRKEKDIDETLEPLITAQVCIQSTVVDADVRTLVCNRLENDRQLKKWPPKVKQEILNTLMAGSNGMFRWVICQLDALKKCLKPDSLYKALKSLPKTLDGTYDRILSSIDEEYSQDAFKILQWLVYSDRPLRIDEVAEVIAIDLDGLQFNPDSRLVDPRDVLTICSSLVTTATSTARDEDGDTYEIELLRLAHFSVKEYLVSNRVRTGLAAKYNIQECADARLAQTCLIYLLYFQGSQLPTLHTLSDFPLVSYAARKWARHVRAATDKLEVVNQLVLRFLSTRDSCLTWIRVAQPEHQCLGVDMTVESSDIGSPLYYASMEGLDSLVKILLDSGADVNGQGSFIGKALKAAAHNGHKDIVAQLLSSGADVNDLSGEGCIGALGAASARGHEDIVVQLLEAGADVNAEKQYSDTALQAASRMGYIAIVERLLDAGADVNAPGRFHGNALYAAVVTGREGVFVRLLEAGADVNAQNGILGTAVHAASARENVDILNYLLECGADVNAPAGGHYATALQTASARGNKDVVTQLLESGAIVNAQGGYYGNALQAASLYGYEDIVVQLLASGADVNAQGGNYGNALQAASVAGQVAVVARLLDAGGDVNAQGGLLGNALYAAAANQHDDVVAQLLEAGADINTKGPFHGTPLQVSALVGCERIVRRLLESGADVNAPGGYSGNALGAASFGDRQSIMRLLLENGAVPLS